MESSQISPIDFNVFQVKYRIFTWKKDVYDNTLEQSTFSATSRYFSFLSYQLLGLRVNMKFKKHAFIDLNLAATLTALTDTILVWLISTQIQRESKH